MLTAFVEAIVSDVCKKGRKTGAPVVEEIVSDEWKTQ
jgi:hypothetical protein